MNQIKSMITFNDLPYIRKRHPSIIVYITGVFDLLHPGHIAFFERCKTFGNTLVVGIGNDAQVSKLKPGRPFHPETWRQYTVASLKPVDYCFIGPPESEIHPLKIVELGFATLRPDIYVIRYDAFDIPFRQELAEKFNVNLVVLPRSDPPDFENEEMTVSTSLIIKRIRNSPE